MSMDTIWTIGTILIVFTAINGIIIWFVIRKRNGKEDSQPSLLIQNQLQELSRIIDSKFGETTREMRESVKHQFSQSQKLIQDVNTQMIKHLTNVSKGMAEANESSKQVLTITEQLRNLEKVLKHQKQRGNLGEASLELILSNILPVTAYKLQYRFDDGDMADAVIITKEGVISVDAKFSLDNYNRLINEEDENRKIELEKEFKKDLKKRIDETAKYIKPKNGTLPFAFMFIPAEGIYYDLLINEIGAIKVNTRSLIDYAYKDKNVIIVSPTTFAAYLQSVLYGFRAFKIEESAKEIAERVEDLGRHIKSHEDYMKKLGGSLGTTVGHYNSAYKELKKVDKDVARVTRGSSDMEPLALERPTLDEDID